MHLGAVDGARTAEMAVGAVLLAVVVAVAAAQVVRWLRHRERVEEGTPALARFADAETSDIAAFGGGAVAARVLRRIDTVTYGYLAVAEEWAAGGATWCTLTITLPGRVPFVVVDHRSVAGRPDVPMAAPHRVASGHPGFDGAYLAGGEDVDLVRRLLGPVARAVLLDSPVQRLMLRDRTLLLRTFDGAGLAPAAWLDAVATRFLATTPSFVASALASAGRDDPLPEGRYGVATPE